ncbi:hypothetical protein MPH_04923 [Macrophomina phaseolina MS6]|uniref:Uncharacterized protein n=1 Tax=Macrophomina phaseolina (strain MS6) TaxID=1126212 RepID=K2RYR4_MACPH|nr:hypothetical protein MPH_04923 [Macrophomina phaseolina MS6]
MSSHVIMDFQIVLLNIPCKQYSPDRRCEPSNISEKKIIYCGPISTARKNSSNILYSALTRFQDITREITSTLSTCISLLKLLSRYRIRERGHRGLTLRVGGFRRVLPFGIAESLGLCPNVGHESQAIEGRLRHSERLFSNTSAGPAHDEMP